MIGKLTALCFVAARDGLTQSLIIAFLCCRRRFLYMINRWAKPDEPLFGNIVHFILDNAYSNNKRLPTEKEINKWADVYKPKHPIGQEELELERTKAAAIMVVYFEIYKKDWEFKRFRRAEGKVSCIYALVKLLGKIDLEWLDKQGKIWHMEHKSMARIEEERIMLKLNIDFQNLFYLHLKKIISGTLPIGVIYNIIRNPQPRKYENKAALYKQILESARKDPKHFFMRYEVKYSASQYATFLEELDHQLCDLTTCILGASTEDKFYKNSGACQSPYPCKYLEACATAGKGGNYIQNETIHPELEE